MQEVVRKEKGGAGEVDGCGAVAKVKVEEVEDRVYSYFVEGWSGERVTVVV